MKSYRERREIANLSEQLVNRWPVQRKLLRSPDRILLPRVCLRIGDDDLWLDGQDDPLTEQGKMTERIRRPNYGNLLRRCTEGHPVHQRQRTNRLCAVAYLCGT
jgi:hypothetical protein